MLTAKSGRNVEPPIKPEKVTKADRDFETRERIGAEPEVRHEQQTKSQQTVKTERSRESEQNSQAGPYSCELINSSTGRACNSTFSRIHDLARHNNTVHSDQELIVCPICTKRKTFSRHDALLRHMNVAH